MESVEKRIKGDKSSKWGGNGRPRKGEIVAQYSRFSFFFLLLSSRVRADLFKRLVSVTTSSGQSVKLAVVCFNVKTRFLFDCLQNIKLIVFLPCVSLEGKARNSEKSKEKALVFHLRRPVIVLDDQTRTSVYTTLLKKNNRLYCTCIVLLLLLLFLLHYHISASCAFDSSVVSQLHRRYSNK